MTQHQVLAVKCAYADLIGSLENYERGSYHEHDWDAHRTTIEELESEFDFLTETNANNQTENKDADNA